MEVPIAAVGASAGGITALESFFKALPPGFDLALVIIQHLLPGQPSKLSNLSNLSNLISGWTTMTVQEAADGACPERNHVYVASPNDVVTLELGVLRTRPAEGGHRRPGIDTIDAFFESLAAERGASAIAVVLSGTGHDGTAGSICIHQAGGLILVQDPATAMHPGMPLAVTEANVADLVLPVGAIAQELVRAASPSYVRPRAPASYTMASSVDTIIELIREQVGLDLSGYKITPLLWRLQQRMDLRRAHTFQDYAALLSDDPAELEELIRRIPIHVTEFFRDPEAWDVLAHEVVNRLIEDCEEGRSIRTWTAGCATGEEAYSIGMLLTEYAEARADPPDFQVFATDAAREILARASSGSFTEQAVKSLTPERKARFFYTADGAWRVKRGLREKMVFAPQDLLNDPPLSDLDLVSCRNLLIYLEPEAIRRVLYLLNSSLRMGGYLFLGKGETLSASDQGFEPVSEPWRIYRKIRHAPAVDIDFPTRLQRIRHAMAGPTSAHRTVAEQSEFPSVLIDGKFQILRVHGATEPYLRVPPGQPTSNLLHVAHPMLAPDLEILVKEAIAKRERVTWYGLDPSATGFALSLHVTPMQTGAHDDPPRLLISFIQQSMGSARTIPEFGPLPPKREDQGVRSLTEAMRISQHELEASREELQALNEELRASNDQLNLSNEDLSRKIAELEMQSRVLSSGEVITLFLDPELRLRWFTQPASELFPILPSDTGRRIGDFVQQFDDKAFLPDIRTVLETGELREAEVSSSKGRWFQRRVLPFISGTGAASGVAITFTDITERKAAATALRQSEAKYRVLFDSIDDGFCIVEVLFDEHGHPTDYVFEEVNAVFEQQTGIKNAVGRRMREIEPEHEQYWYDIYGRMALSGEPARFEDRAAAFGRMFDVYAFRVDEPERRRLAILFRDITQRKFAEDKLRESEERFRAFISATSDVVYRMAPDWAEMRQLHGREFIADTLEPSRTWLDTYIYADDQEDVRAKIQSAIDTKSVFDLEHRVIRADGSVGWTHSRAIPILDTNGEIVEWFGTACDVTRRKHAEAALRESEERLRTVIEAAPLAIALIGSSGEILYRNPSFDELWGRPPHVTTARTHSEVYEGYHLDGRRIASEEWPGARAVLEGKVVEDEVYEIVDASGRRIPCWFGAAPIRNASGDITGAVVVFRVCKPD